MVLFNHFHGTTPQLISSQIRTMFKIKWSCFVTGALLSYAPTNSPSASHQLLSDRVNSINSVFVNLYDIQCLFLTSDIMVHFQLNVWDWVCCMGRSNMAVQ